MLVFLACLFIIGLNFYISNVKIGRLSKVIFIGFLFRIIFIFLTTDFINDDIRAYYLIGQQTLIGKAIYPKLSPIYHPYFPFFLYIEAGAVLLSKFFLSVGFWIKALILCFDLGNIWLIFRLSKKNLKTATLYSLNPIIILISFYHGQFDAIVLFFLLWSVYLWQQKKELASIFSLSFSVLVKPWPLLFIYPILKRFRNYKLLLLIVFFPLLSVIIYSLLFNVSFIDIITPIKNYRGLFGWWGVGKVYYLTTGYSAPHQTRIIRILFFIILGLYMFLFNKRKNIFNELTMLILFFYCFTFSLSIQYFSWIIPFLLLSKISYQKQTILLTSIYLITVYFIKLNLYQDFIIFCGLVLWIVYLIIFFRNIKK